MKWGHDRLHAPRRWNNLIMSGPLDNECTSADRQTNIQTDTRNGERKCKRKKINRVSKLFKCYYEHSTVNILYTLSIQMRDFYIQNLIVDNSIFFGGGGRSQLTKKN